MGHRHLRSWELPDAVFIGAWKLKKVGIQFRLPEAHLFLTGLGYSEPEIRDTLPDAGPMVSFTDSLNLPLRLGGSARSRTWCCPQTTDWVAREDCPPDPGAAPCRSLHSAETQDLSWVSSNVSHVQFKLQYT